jgi:GDPmannose 4,6-dehydratase
MFAVNGILFNHESPRRGDTFVTKKIARAAARISQGKQDLLYLGNLSARRDWGYAPEYVDAMWRMLQAENPEDYVVATNTSFSVEDFCDFTFEVVGLNWRDYVKFDENYLRPTEVDDLRGDFSKIKRDLNWEPKTFAPELAKIMVTAELN